MLVTRYHPIGQSWFRRMHDLHDEMNRLFEGWSGLPQAGDSNATFPPLNIFEAEDAFHVEAELPGLALKDLEIYVANQNQLTIKGERPSAAPAKAAQHRLERHSGKFTRVVTLPTAVDDAKVEARLENGVLTIKLPKHESTKPRKIVIKS